MRREDQSLPMDGGRRALPACGRVRVTHCARCVPETGWGLLAMLCVPTRGECVEGEISVVGVCSSPWECVCRRVLAGAWVTPCVEHAPLSGAECAGSGEYV